MSKRPRLIDSGVLLVYAIISVVMTWPLIANLSGHTLFGTIDDYVYLWAFWWMGYALQSLHTWPLHTNMIYHPLGTGLAFNTDTPLLGILSIPVQNASGVAVAYNLAVLASFIFSAFTMYLLVNYLIGDKKGAFLGGIVFAFSTFKFYQATGHLSNISTQFFPLYVLFFIKMLREPGRQYRAAAFAGLTLGFMLATDYYQVVYALFFSICYLVYYLLGRAGVDAEDLVTLPRRVFNGSVLLSLLKRATLLLVVFIIVGSPIIYAIFSDIRDGYYVKLGGEDTFYADAAAFFVPASPLFRSLPWLAQMMRPIIHGGGVESLVYAGWIVIVLVAVGTALLTRRLADFRFWLVFMLLCFLLALGPQPHFLGTVLPIPGPYALWAAVPLLNNARIPARFDILITLAAGVLVGYSVREILTRLTHRVKMQPAMFATAFVLIATPLILLENLVIPLTAPVPPLDEPAYFSQIANEPGDFAVLTLPAFSGVTPRSMYDQTIHQKKILAAYISRPLPDFYNYYMSDEFMSILSSNPTIAKGAESAVQKVLTDTKAMNFYRLDAAGFTYYLDVRYIVVYPQSLPPGDLDFLNAALPLEQVYPATPYEDDKLLIYRVLSDKVKALAETNTIDLGGKDAAIFRLMGWYEPYTDQAGGFSFAWLGTASGQLLTTVRVPADYTVTMQLQPMIVGNRPQTLTIYANDETSPVARFVLPKYEWQQRSFTVTRDHWLVGINKLRLEMTYATQPGNGDGRTYSIAIRSISFTSKR